MNISAYLKINSSGTATCSSDMIQRLSDGSSELVMNLQKLNSGKWTTIATWTNKGLIECSNIASKNVTKGTYRLSVTGKVYDNSRNFTETATIYSTTGDTLNKISIQKSVGIYISTLLSYYKA